MVVITRHPALIELLKDHGITEAKVISHATEHDVRDEHVIGVLPLHLAALAAKVTVPVLDVPPSMRGLELSKSELETYFRGFESYRVELLKGK